MNEIKIAHELTLLKLEGDLSGEIIYDCFSVISNEKVKCRKIILDFCGVTFVHKDFVDGLLNLIDEKFQFINCSTRLKNILINHGLASRLIS